MLQWQTEASFGVSVEIVHWLQYSLGNVGAVFSNVERESQWEQTLATIAFLSGFSFSILKIMMTLLLNGNQ